MKILLDGSNLLYWRGGAVQPDLPQIVVGALVARRYKPVVYFDNTIRRHMADEALAALWRLAVVHIAPRGTPADALLLEACVQGRLQIVSHDRFESWRARYPALRRDWLVTGRIGKGGRVSFSKKLRRVPL